MAQEEYRQVVARLEPSYSHAGWLLRQIAIDLAASAKQVAREDSPDPYVCITSADAAIRLQTKVQRNVLSARWSSDFFFPDKAVLDFAVWDSNTVAKDTLLGIRRIRLDQKLPKSLPADSQAQIHWSGSFDWVSVHY